MWKRQNPSIRSSGMARNRTLDPPNTGCHSPPYCAFSRSAESSDMVWKGQVRSGGSPSKTLGSHCDPSRYRQPSTTGLVNRAVKARAATGTCVTGPIQRPVVRPVESDQLDALGAPLPDLVLATGQGRPAAQDCHLDIVGRVWVDL